MFDICNDVPPLACENWVRDAVMPWLFVLLPFVVIFVVGVVLWLMVRLWRE